MERVIAYVDVLPRIEIRGISGSWKSEISWEGVRARARAATGGSWGVAAHPMRPHTPSGHCAHTPSPYSRKVSFAKKSTRQKLRVPLGAPSTAS
jgi:hypothetical protein